MNKVLTQIQIFLERTAYYCAYTAIVLLMVYPVERGGFSLEPTQRNALIMILSSIISFLPIFAGRLCDFFGCRKSQLFALGMNLVGFHLLILNAYIASSAHSTSTVFILSMISAILIGLGTGLFYPAAYGKLAQSFHPKYLGIGFAIAIILANIGGFLSAIIKSISIDDCITGIYIAAVLTLINILLTAIPDKSLPTSMQPESTECTERPVSYKTIILFLLTITLFFIPVSFQTDLMDKYFIDWMPKTDISELIDTSIVSVLPDFSSSAFLGMNLILNAIALVLIIPLTLILSRFKRRTGLLTGMVLFIASLIPLCFIRTNIFSIYAILPLQCGLYLFTIKLLEYLAVNAPANRKATFMGLYKLPIALSGLLSYVPIYNLFFAKRTLTENALMHMDIDTSALSTEQQQHSLSEILDLSDSEQLTQFLWEHHHPWHLWVILGVIGAFSIILVSSYLKRHSELNAHPTN